MQWRRKCRPADRLFVAVGAQALFRVGPATAYLDKQFQVDLGAEQPLQVFARLGGNLLDALAAGIVVADESHLTNIAVTPEHRRKSVAKLLLERILQIVADLDCTLILLEVRPSNREAIGFYEKYGFDLLYRRPNYYRRPIEDALVMVRHLTDNED